MKPPHVEVVDVVTREHARAFAEGWLRETRGGVSIIDVFNETGIMTWPDAPEGDLHDPREERYQEIEREILHATFAIAKDAIADAFFMAATVVLTRERGR